MDEIILILLLVAGAVFILPIIALVKASTASRRADALDREIGVLREANARLQKRLDRLEAGSSPPHMAEALSVEPKATIEPTVVPDEPVSAEVVEPEPVIEASVPPPLPVAKAPEPVRSSGFSPSERPKPVAKPQPGINLEQFMGAKLFAWVGGLALFLGIIFFVKLSIERGWVSPATRTAIGFVIGTGLVGGGVVMSRRERYATLASTLCATGIVILYGVTFAAHSIWRIPPFDHALAAFGMMTLITAAAFLLAVRLNAQVVAVLGMLGGFLTPILCSTGHDNPLGLFSYIALLDIGVLAVAKNKRWLHLTALAAAGTIFMQAGWMMKFFRSSEYAIGAATWVPVSVFLGFAALFSLAAWWSKQRDADDLYPAGAALALCGSAMFTAFVFLGFGAITERPVLLYTFVLGINAVALRVVWHQSRVAIAQSIVGMLTFIHLSIWTTQKLTPELLP